jgi:hypothetical protein
VDRRQLPAGRYIGELFIFDMANGLPHSTEMDQGIEEKHTADLESCSYGGCGLDDPGAYLSISSLA